MIPDQRMMVGTVENFQFSTIPCMKEKIKLRFQPPEQLTEIMIGHGLFQEDQFSNRLLEMGRDFYLICDTNVEKNGGKKLKHLLHKQGLKIHGLAFPAGEKNKNRQNKEEIEDMLLDLGAGRDSTIIAMGGGVVTDVAGFLAATYLRGIPWVALPTTLLGMVDASIGGKTGLNTRFGKNLIGAYHPPQMIFMDPDLLKSLPASEWRNGIAEIIKYGLVLDSDLFGKLSEQKIKWGLSFLEEVLYRSVEIKKKVVEEDLLEKGFRRVVNFGHTIGHAIEVIENYRISHGEAIAIGMIVESRLSHICDSLSKLEVEQIEAIFKRYGFVLTLSKKVTVEKMLLAMSKDKKALFSAPRFVLLQSIGRVTTFQGDYCTTVEDKPLTETLKWMVKRFQK